MPRRSKPHAGSLQYWPRVRAKKIVPSVNWKPIKKDSGLQGFIGYKVGMSSAYVKDNTEDSMTKGKRITVPATIVECPEMKIYSVRLYKGGKVMKDVVVSNDKELKKVIKTTKNLKKVEDVKEEFDDVRVLVYSGAKDTGIKNKPDMIELAISGSKEDKLAFVAEKIGKGISVSEVFPEGLVDARGVTKGFGFSGTVKRFGVSLKAAKSEKGQRRPGSIGAFGMRRVTFRAPQAGQHGYFTRIAYNNMILKSGKISEDNINPDSGFHKYGDIRTEYLVIRGSIPGVKKRAVLLTAPLRPTKFQAKKQFEVLELR